VSNEYYWTLEEVLDQAELKGGMDQLFHHWGRSVRTPSAVFNDMWDDYCGLMDEIEDLETRIVDYIDSVFDETSWEIGG
jgi:hypothetical protein